jgi:hypothetical protein
MKSDMLRLVEHVATMGNTRLAYRIFGENILEDIHWNDQERWKITLRGGC